MKAPSANEIGWLIGIVTQWNVVHWYPGGPVQGESQLLQSKTGIQNLVRLIARIRVSLIVWNPHHTKITEKDTESLFVLN
jgi:hypothetical protein